MPLLFIDDDTQQKIKKVISFAEGNPLSSSTDLVPMILGEQKPVMFRPDFGVEIPVGFQATFTIEQYFDQPRMRHLSVRVDRAGKLPSWAAVEVITQAFGFQRPLLDCRVFVDETHEAINVMEEIV